MLQLVYTRILSFGIVISTSIVYLILSSKINAIIELSGISQAIIPFFNVATNFVAFTTPILYYVFFIMTTRIMLVLTDLNFSKEKSIDLPSMIGLCFLPLLIYSSLYVIGLSSLDPDMKIADTQDIQSVTLFWGLKFDQIKMFGTVAWVFVYVLLILLLRRFVIKSFWEVVPLALLPTAIVLLLKEFFEYFA